MQSFTLLVHCYKNPLAKEQQAVTNGGFDSSAHGLFVGLPARPQRASRERQPLFILSRHLKAEMGRIYECGDRSKLNKASKRPLTQASLRCRRWLKPSSLQRIPTPLNRCWMSHLQALSTIPEPSGKPRALYAA